MTELHELSAQDRALLSLVVARSMSYEQIGTRLRMDPEIVRTRAHAAIRHLARPPAGIDPFLRTRMLDFVLGQRSAQDLGGQLRRPDVRDWTISVTSALAPLAGQQIPTPVPGRPGQAETAPPEHAAPRAATAAETPTAARPKLLPGRGAMPALAALGLLFAAAIVTAVLTSSNTTSTSATDRPPHGPVPSVQLIRRLALAPTAAAGQAAAAGAVIRKGTSLQLVLQAKGLASNNGDSYAVWLFNTPVDARLLGFVSPQVKSSGTFSSGVTLPTDAIRFRLVLVTRETRARPSAPGVAVLRGPLSLA